MTVADTSIEAYRAIEHTLPDRQREVIEALRSLGSASNLDVADYLNRPINTITSPMLNLRVAGLVVSDGKRPGRYGVTVNYWRVA
jgi:predicted transcriptional regulator